MSRRGTPALASSMTGGAMTGGAMTSFAIDAEWVRGATAPRGVLAGSPPVWFTVTDEGAAILDALEAGAPLPHGHEPLTDRLLARGAIHPVPGAPVDAGLLTVVIPARVDAGGASVLAALVARLTGDPGSPRVIVVDDSSDPPLRIPGADVVPHVGPHGPGPARNTGLTRVTTPFVAFVDADATIDAAALCRLASLIDHESTVLVAPRVASAHAGRNGEYETVLSPLDLGPVRARVRPMSRISYVPAAVVVASTRAVRDLGGFDGGLRWGEDVDLVWRATEMGLVCRYEPSVRAEHSPRPTMRAFCVQRFRYGTSAAPLARRHGTTVAPWRGSLPVLAVAVSCLTVWWQVAIPLTVAVWAWFVIGLGRTGLSGGARSRVASRALVRGVGQTAHAIRRAWWPIIGLAAAVSLRASIALALSFTVPLVAGLVRHRPRGIPRWIALRVLDDLAYGAGLWWGAIVGREARCLVPIVSVRPARVG